MTVLRFKRLKPNQIFKNWNCRRTKQHVKFLKLSLSDSHLTWHCTAATLAQHLVTHWHHLPCLCCQQLEQKNNIQCAYQYSSIGIFNLSKFVGISMSWYAVWMVLLHQTQVSMTQFITATCCGDVQYGIAMFNWLTGDRGGTTDTDTDMQQPATQCCCSAMLLH